MPSALVVDDNEQNLYLLRTLLTANGYEVRAATNGREALDIAERSAPDVVISDILMPVMDGFTLCRTWRQHPTLKRIPFVVYTATYTDPKDEQLALSLGADLFIVKPTEPDAFIELVSGVLARHRERALHAAATEPVPETLYLREYNEALVRKLEEKLIDLERANRTLALKSTVIEASISGIALADPDGTCTYVNASFARMWRGAPENLVGKNLLDLVADREAHAAIEQALTSTGSWLGETNAKRLDGSDFVVQSTIEIVRDIGRQPLCRVISCLDVTDRKRMEQQLQRAQRLQCLDLFAGSVAHDFNNLLTGLFGNLQLVRMALAPNSAESEYLDTALQTFEHAKNLTRQLQSFARMAPSGRTQVDVSQILRESCKLSLGGSNVACDLVVEHGTWNIEADANQMSQVFNNLVINARQAMSAGGTVHIRARDRGPETGPVGDLAAGEYVEISVRDEGPGIPQNILGRVFDPFFTTKPQGSGLGLASCWAIVRDHDGRITAASSEGSGATITVVLPASRAKRPTTPMVAAPVLTGTGRILLLESDPIVRDAAMRFLTLAGYEVATTADSTRRPFDLVILDADVRGERSGTGMLAQLRRENPDAAILVSTSRVDEPMIATVKALGSAAIIPKPYVRTELLDRVQALLCMPTKR